MTARSPLVPRAELDEALAELRDLRAKVDAVRELAGRSSLLLIRDDRGNHLAGSTVDANRLLHVLDGRS